MAAKCGPFWPDPEWYRYPFPSSIIVADIFYSRHITPRFCFKLKHFFVVIVVRLYPFIRKIIYFVDILISFFLLIRRHYKFRNYGRVWNWMNSTYIDGGGGIVDKKLGEFYGFRRWWGKCGQVPSETKFIILISLQSFNLSFPLLFHVISTAILKYLLWFPASPPWFPTFFVFPARFPAFPRWFSAPALPSHSSHSHPYIPQFPHSVLQFPILAFTDSLLSLYFLSIYFRKIVALVKKRTLPFFTTA